MFYLQCVIQILHVYVVEFYFILIYRLVTNS